VISTFALALALAAPAHAAVSDALAAGSVGKAALKDGAVTTRKLRDGVVTARKLRDDAVTSRKIRNGTVQPVDLAASARPRLPAMIATMDAGGRELLPEWSTVLTTTLPRGTWHVMGKGVMFAWNAEVTCDAVAGASNILDRTTLAVPGGSTQMTSPMALLGWVTVTQPTSLSLKCHRNDVGTLARVYDTKLSAVQVGTG
jgi:hypothetical protein